MSPDLFDPGPGASEAVGRGFRPGPAHPLAARAEQFGVGSLSEGETLELYIARSRPNGAGAFAALLLGRFGDLQHVLGASLAELAAVVDRDLALDLKLLHGVAAQILRFPIARRCVLTSWSALLAYLRLQMAGAGVECVRILFLDKKNQLIADEVAGRGTVDHAPVYPREIIKRALELNASALIISHQHPSGDPTPSAADIEITRQVIEAGRALRISVHDHIIVGGDDTISMKALGLI
jgi:DNA repair protein RadC